MFLLTAWQKQCTVQLQVEIYAAYEWPTILRFKRTVSTSPTRDGHPFGCFFFLIEILVYEIAVLI